MTEFKPFRRRSFRGEVHADSLDNLDTLLDRLVSPDRSVVLKQGRARIVWVEEVSGAPYCFKEYLCAKATDRIAAAIRGTRARREWERLKRLFESSVPVPQPILWADTPGAGGWVVTRYLTNTLPLSEAVERKGEFTPEARRRVAERLGDALGRMHRAGARHDDLHPGNILVRMEPTHPEPFLVDLHQVALRRSFSWGARLRNLGRLLGGLQDKLEPSSKQRSLKSYLETLSDWNPPFEVEREARRSMGNAIEKFARRDFEKRWRKRLDKCQEAGKRFHRARAKEYTGWVRAEWDSPELLSRLENPNAWIESEDCRVLKHTPSTTVACGRLPDAGLKFFIKRYNRKSIWERTKNLFRRSRSMKVWRSGFALELLGIPTPEPVCAIEKRRGPFLLESFILTEWVEEGIGFDDFYRERCSPDAANPLSAQDRRSLEREIARLFRRLHAHGISHGDLKGRNVLLDPHAPAPFDPRLVDLDAMRLRPVRFQRERINDLSRLLFSVYPLPSTLRLVRFFREYAKYDPTLWRDRRNWWKKIDRRTRKKLKEKGLL